MWYGHIPEPFEKRTRVALLVIFVFTSVFGFLFPPVFIISAVTGYLLFCELITTAHPCAPDGYQDVHEEANNVVKWFFIISCSFVLILIVVLAILTLM